MRLTIGTLVDFVKEEYQEFLFNSRMHYPASKKKVVEIRDWIAGKWNSFNAAFI